MADQNCFASPEAAGELLDYVYGSMSSTGAPDRDGHVVPVLGDVTRQPLFNESRNVVDHFAHLRSRDQKGSDCFVTAGQGSQVGVVVWIGQIANIEYQIGCDRDAVLEGKRLKRQR